MYLFFIVLRKDALEMFLTKYDIKRLELYSENMTDYHLIMDLLPVITKLYFRHQTDFNLSAAQTVSNICKNSCNLYLTAFKNENIK